MLFLDELTEFRRDAVESLRQPLEDGRRLIQAVAEIDKPAAMARELGVDVSTIAYWIRTLDG